MRKKEQGTLHALNEKMKKLSVFCHCKLIKETAEISGPQGKKVEELEEMREDDTESKMHASWIPVTPAKMVLPRKQSHDQNCPLLYYQRKKSKKSASLNHLLAMAVEEACTSSKSVDQKPCEAGTSSYHVSGNHGFTVLLTSPPENHKTALKGNEDDKKKKKGHSLPKVDLDPETKAYEVPMGKADDGNVEQEAWKENEKKLEKDREVFRGCVQSFIARMHLILGDRKFSSWKGSVMDSVVGAFLSQNASDQSSSSAFMMLASKYPLQPTLKKACHGDEGLANYAESSGVEECALRDTLSGSKRKHSVAFQTKRKKGNLRPKGVKSDRERSDRLDSVDWESIRHADTKDVAEAIQVRGMNSRLAGRIKNFLDRVVKDHGEIDLEWLRKVPAHKVKEFLMSIPGLGLKSVECVLLLTLRSVAFPVDTNVGRIAVRLGWVPIKTLPDQQIHQLKRYPDTRKIQKYLWPRLCTLGQEILYELHYHMITFGKVFCTKKDPNCNACPLRAECRHYASAFASARLALPAPQDTRVLGSKTSALSEPIIDELTLQTPPQIVVPDSESNIEDLFSQENDGIPIIKLDVETFIRNLKELMERKNIPIEEQDMSRALVMKNESRLRTEWQIYILPDEHPLLKEFEGREPDDPCGYLLATWTQEGYHSGESGEQDMEMVLGTILIPCRTATRGSFPLNGTFFQVNEVFADDESSQNPISVPRESLCGLPTGTLYCGVSTTSICKGFSSKDIQNCFWKGFICLRGFNRKTRSPCRLSKRFHVTKSKPART